MYILILFKPNPNIAVDGNRGTALRSANTNNFLAICLKTGMETNIERIPVQLLTFLQAEKPLIISDFDEKIGNHQVINILSAGKQRKTFPSNRHAESIASDEQKPNEKNEGWKLDAGKNFNGFKKMHIDFPDSKWFIMLDDDTYLFKNNLLKHLKTLDYKKPIYIGAPNNFKGCDGVRAMGDGPLFAHGGSGIVLSKAALDKMAPIADGCNVKYASCWAGDIRTALCLRDAGVLFDRRSARGDFHGNPVQKQKFNNPCDKPFTFHHLFPFQIQLLHDLEMDVQLKRGYDAEVNMGEVFTWFIFKDPLLKSTYSKVKTKTLDVGKSPVQFKYRKGLDLKGSDYEHFKSTLNECMVKCYEDENCVSWTFTSSDNFCWKKDGIPIHLEIKTSYSGWFEEKFICKN